MFNDELIRSNFESCFHQICTPIFLSFSSWKRKFGWSKKITLTNKVTNISEKNCENRIRSSIWWAHHNYWNYWWQKNLISKKIIYPNLKLFALARFYSFGVKILYYEIKSNFLPFHFCFGYFLFPLLLPQEYILMNIMSNYPNLTSILSQLFFSKNLDKIRIRLR